MTTINTHEINPQSFGPLPPPWGWKGPASGRVSHVDSGVEFQGTTVQMCGLYPFVAGSGSPVIGAPIGRHLYWGETVGLDPIDWLNAGWVTNPGVYILGEPGCGKSTIAKRLALYNVYCGRQVLVLGDTKPDYTPLVEHLGGQVIRVGRGMDRINPLDSGPLAAALPKLTGQQADQLRLDIRNRRLSLLLALCALIRREGLSNAEEVILGAAIDILTAEGLDQDPTVPDVLKLIEGGHPELTAAARAHDEMSYRDQTRGLVHTLALLCEGSLKGIFDGPTTTPIDLASPAVSIDISRVASSGDIPVAAAMLSTWAYTFAVMDAAALLAELGLAPRRQFLGIMDELWRAIRGTSGLVEHADALTRLNRQRGMGTIMITHSLADMESLRSEDDRSKARGFLERCSIAVLAALSLKELRRVSEIKPLTAAEINQVKSWAAPESWLPGAVHPGRGKYLIKTGDRPGLPVQLSLVGEEARLYDTDMAIRR